MNLIEKNPITRLSKDYQNNLINKIKARFNENQQQLFAGSFYCYLNHNPKKDFVINLNDVWKWIGFARKDNAKKLLEKYFIENLDYKVSLRQLAERKKERGGQNKEDIFMPVNIFKKLCLRADTKKANEIHDYYITLEEILQETIDEETQELREQLNDKKKELVEKDKVIEKNEIKHKSEMKINKHNILLEKFKGKRCVYVGEIYSEEITCGENEERFMKVGSTKNIYERYKQLVDTFGNFIFVEIYDCENFREVEESILLNSFIKKHLYRSQINGYISREVVKLTKEFNYNHFIEIVKSKLAKKNTFLSPEQILEREKMEFEKKKLDHEMLIKIIDNPNYNETVKKILDENLPCVIKNLNINNLDVINENKEIESDLQPDETHNPNYNLTIDTNVKK